MKDNNKSNLKVIGDHSVNMDIPKEENNFRAIEVLKEYGLEGMQFLAQDNELFPSDFLMFRNEYTHTVDVVDCIRAIQILQANGFKLDSVQIDISIGDDGIVERPVGEIIFEAY